MKVTNLCNIICSLLLGIAIFCSCSKDDDSSYGITNTPPNTSSSTENNDDNLGGKDDDKIDNEKEEDVRYYVKYKLDMPSLHINVRKTIRFVTENGVQSFDTMDMQWEGTYGPLKKGTKLFLECASHSQSEYNYSQTNYHGCIYVCREKEPFVIKAEDSGKHDISLLYFIDF